jgi:hypothetical protein
VLRTFYDFHLDRNTGSLLVNPFPLVRNRRSARANAHHNPEKEHKRQRTGLYRPKVPKRIPRRIPDDKLLADSYSQDVRELRRRPAVWDGLWCDGRSDGTPVRCLIS